MTCVGPGLDLDFYTISGNNIDCYPADDAVKQYCWVTGTHLLVKSDDERYAQP